MICGTVELFAHSPMWCRAVNSDNSGRNGSGKSMKVQNTNTVRASISFPPDIYESLEEVAKEKKGSLAWVVRDAAEPDRAEFGHGGDLGRTSGEPSIDSPMRLFVTSSEKVNRKMRKA